MAAKDTASKLFFSQSDVAAELINDFIFKGKEEHIEPSQLRLVDPSELNLKRGEDGCLLNSNQYRDILFSCVSADNPQEELFRFGIEEQSYIDIDMVLRIMGYDIAECRRQRKEGVKKLIPVMTAVVNLSTKRWTASKSYLDLYGEKGKRYARFLPNFNINVIEPKDIPEKFFLKKYTKLKLVLHCCKLSDNLKKLMRMLKKVRLEVSLDEITRNLLEVILGIKIESPEAGGTEEMCEGLRKEMQKIKDESFAKGEAKGEAKGRKLEKIRLISSALKTGLSVGVISSIVKLPKKSVLAIANGDYSCI